MSGIVGIVNRNGRPVDAAAVQHMLAAIAHRGPDASATWNKGRIGLACNRLGTAPSAAGTDAMAAGHGVVLAADVRLDNREELAEGLGLVPTASTDEDLIIAAYQRWGEDCTKHLLGDFAFALWDRSREILFCARDHFGVKPFYFHIDSTAFSFASEIKALFTLGNVTRRIDEAKIADYLVALPGDPDATLYVDIRQLPARHSLTLSRNGLNLRPYWQIEPRTAPRSDAAAELRALLGEAVRCRLRSAGPVGAMLSGGLDSSSIAAIAAPLVAAESPPLRTFSLVFDKTPAQSERSFIEAVQSKGGFDPHFIDCDDYAPFADWESLLAEQDGAFLAPGLALTRRLYYVAARQGVRVLLDGHGGDEVISHGYGRLHELARAGRWLSLWRNVSGVSATYGESGWPLFRAYAMRHGPGRTLRRAKRIATRTLGGTRQPPSQRPNSIRFVNPELAARTDLVERHRAARAAEAAVAESEGLRHAQLLDAPRVSRSFGVLDRAAAAAGIEPRYPFWDKRVVEFCLSLPADEKLRGGWTRSVLRRAMDGVLPAAVQWRRDKLDFAPHMVRGMLARHSDMLHELIHRGDDGLGTFVDTGEAAAAYDRIVARPDRADGYDVQIVWRTTMLALWLRQLGQTPTRQPAAA